MFFLPAGESGTIGYFGNGVAHGVEEDGAKASYLERDVEDAVVDGRLDALAVNQDGLR